MAGRVWRTARRGHISSRPASGPAKDFMPDYLISLTAPKPLAKFFKGERHFTGGRFLPTKVAEKYGLTEPVYEGIDQIREEEVGGEDV
ncbi:hypothetical protein BJ508DRAFT_414455 [Ascobolus immersus RN42]|uniref:Uncharacterized protein n=1 Tax=Ascobolus immersus RN42 TaxID=1160509 RepID=A0A3N4I7B9_ASCIM|nr:hypothetical protein BJ508DRAFT_414455 [Ascobolus immersus RN42]